MKLKIFVLLLMMLFVFTGCDNTKYYSSNSKWQVSYPNGNETYDEYLKYELEFVEYTDYSITIKYNQLENTYDEKVTLCMELRESDYIEINDEKTFRDPSLHNVIPQSAYIVPLNEQDTIIKFHFESRITTDNNEIKLTTSTCILLPRGYEDFLVCIKFYLKNK